MSKTVFVVGAGASHEVGLPIGRGLRDDIARLIDIRYENGFQQSGGDPAIADAFSLAANQEDPPSRDINPYLHTSWRIRDAMPQALSIDNFIDVHSDDQRLVLCGKLAIARAILEAEQKSKLYAGRPSSPSA